MYSILHLFKKLLTLSIFLLTVTVFTQTPQYYNYNTTGGGNAFPLSQALGKMVQWVFLPGDFNQPTGARSGNITSLSIMAASTGSGTYTSLFILIGQDTITSLPATFYTGQRDTVYKRASVTLSSTLGQWLTFTFDTPHSFDSTKSLIVQIEQCGMTGTGITVAQTTLTNNRRCWSATNAPCPWTPYGPGTQVLNMGINVTIPLPPAPPYYNYNNGTINNYYPLEVTSGKMCQWLVGPGEINQPGPAPSGYIIGFYFRIFSSYPFPATTYTNIKVLLGQSSITTLPSGQFYTGTMDTAYKRANVTLGPFPVNTWGLIPLDDTSFVYNPAQSLIIQIEQCQAVFSGSQEYPMTLTPSSGNRRNWSVGGCPFSYSLEDANVIDCGLYIDPLIGVKNPTTEIPNAFELKQNYPNPFNPVTKIEFAIPKSGNVELKVYNDLGQVVATLMDGFKTAGKYSVDFNGENVASGVYFYTLKSGDFRDTKKMMLIK